MPHPSKSSDPFPPPEHTPTHEHTREHSYSSSQSCSAAQAGYAANNGPSDSPRHNQAHTHHDESFDSELTSSSNHALTGKLASPELLPFFFIHPNSKLFAIWKVILILAVWFTCFETSFVVGFNIITSIPGNKYPILVVVNIIVDAAMLIDIWIYSRKGYYDDTLVLESSAREIRLKYIKSWLAVDLIAAMPMEFIQLCIIGSTSDTTELSVVTSLEFQLLKLGRLGKMTKVINFSESILGSKSIEQSLEVNEAIRAFFAFVYVLLIGHFVACGWFLLHRLEKLSDPTGHTWVTVSQLTDAKILDQYIAALYWSFATLISIGFGGHINPTNMAERIYTIAVVVLAALAYAQVIGNFMLVIDNLNHSQAHHDSSQSNIQYYMSRYKFPRELSRRIYDYQSTSYEYLNNNIGKHVYLRQEQEEDYERMEEEDRIRTLQRHRTMRQAKWKVEKQQQNAVVQQQNATTASAAATAAPGFTSPNASPRASMRRVMTCEGSSNSPNRNATPKANGTLDSLDSLPENPRFSYDITPRLGPAPSNLPPSPPSTAAADLIPGSTEWLEHAIEHYDEERVTTRPGYGLSLDTGPQLGGAAIPMSTVTTIKERSEDRILSTLPQCYNLEINLHLHSRMLYSIYLFRDLNSSILSALTRELRTRLYVRDDFICKKKLLGRCMYIIKRGTAEKIEYSEIAKKILMKEKKMRDEVDRLIKAGPGHANQLMMKRQQSEKTMIERSVSKSPFASVTTANGGGGGGGGGGLNNGGGGQRGSTIQGAPSLPENLPPATSPLAQPTIRSYSIGYHFGESSYLHGYFNESIRVSSAVAEVCLLHYSAFLKISEAFPEFAKCVIGSVEKRQVLEKQKQKQQAQKEEELKEAQERLHQNSQITMSSVNAYTLNANTYTNLSTFTLNDNTLSGNPFMFKPRTPTKHSQQQPPQPLQRPMSLEQMLHGDATKRPIGEGLQEEKSSMCGEEPFSLEITMQPIHASTTSFMSSSDHDLLTPGTGVEKRDSFFHSQTTPFLQHSHHHHLHNQQQQQNTTPRMSPSSPLHEVSATLTTTPNTAPSHTSSRRPTPLVVPSAAVSLGASVPIQLEAKTYELENEYEEKVIHIRKRSESFSSTENSEQHQIHSIVVSPVHARRHLHHDLQKQREQQHELPSAEIGHTTSSNLVNLLLSSRSVLDDADAASSSSSHSPSLNAATPMSESLEVEMKR